jgi:uncharacterized protein (DUF1697 family)
MSRLVAFLRAINVGGHTVKMDALRGHFEDLGCTGVETFIASGNVVFDHRVRDAEAMARKIERHLLKKLGYEVSTFLRTGDEVAAVAAYRAFTDVQVKAARAQVVGFLEAPLPAASTRALMALETPDDTFRVHGREIWWLARSGQGQSEISLAVIEKTLKIRATFRGANTVRRLAAKYGFVPPP